MSKSLSSDLVGLEATPTSVSWSKKDVLLYACGVGARPDTELEFLYEGRGPKVLPTFAAIKGGIGLSALLSGGVNINPAMILHGQEGIELHRELPASCTAKATGRITEVWDKGKAAVVTAETVVADDDGPLFTE